MTSTRWPLIVLGAATALIGSSLVVGGAALLGAQVALRDDAGFYTSPTYRLATDSYAVVLDADLDRWPTSPVRPSQFASIQVTTQSTGDQAVFAGIARQSDIDGYLAEVAVDEVSDVENGAVVTRTVAGGALPAPPGEQTFWVASSAGSGHQSLRWPVEDGQWSLVVMNLDGTASLNLTVSAGARIAYVTPVALTLLAVGLLGLIGGVVIIRGPGHRGAVTAPVHPSFGMPIIENHPLQLSATIDVLPGRWLWLVKWILLVPHIVVLTVLWAGFLVAAVAAGLCILITGRYPRRLFDFNVGVLRWTWRVGHYGYLSLGTDRYPPFTLQAVPYPAQLEVGYPTELSRWLVLVKWLLVVPHLVIVGILVGSTFGVATSSSWPAITGGLIGVLVLVAALHLAFVRRYPQGVFDLLIGLSRWMFRVITYAALMTDVYPPFRLDLGGTEPDPAPRIASDIDVEHRPLVTAAP
jgi:hypothetical protein